MIARFLHENFPVRTDRNGFEEAMAAVHDPEYQSRYGDNLSDGKPFPWFFGEDRTNRRKFVCHAQPRIDRRRNVFVNYIIIDSFDERTDSAPFREVSGCFGMVPLSDEKALKLSAQYVRNFMKVLSKMNTIKEMIEKIQKNKKHLTGYDWTDGKMEKIV